MDYYYQFNKSSLTFESCLKYLQMDNYEATYSMNIIRLHLDKPKGFIFKARSLYGMGKIPDAGHVLLEAFKNC